MGDFLKDTTSECLAKLVIQIHQIYTCFEYFDRDYDLKIVDQENHTKFEPSVQIRG